MVSDSPSDSDAESKTPVVDDSNGNSVPSDGMDTFSIVTMASFVLVNVHVMSSPADTVSPASMSNPPVQVTSVLNHPSGSGVSSLA